MITRNIMLNGSNKVVIASENETLATILRAQLGLTGTKVGCGQGQCGACNVIMDGKLVRSCITKLSRVADGATVTTIEGIGTPAGLHPLQLAGSPMVVPSADSAAPVSSFRPKFSWTRIPTRPVIRSANGFRNTGTSAVVPDTNRWSTRSWMLPRSCAARWLPMN